MSSQIGWPEGASAECGSDMPERLADDLRGGRRAEELAAAAGRGAGAAAELGGFFQRSLAVREARADRLDLARVLAVAPAAASRRRARARRAGRASPPAPSSSPAGPCRRSRRRARPARRQRADQPAEDDRGVVAIGQAVHHAGRALRPAVAGVGDNSRRTGRRPGARSSSAAACTSRPTSQWPV